MRRRSDALTPDLFDIPQAPAPIGGSLDYASELSHVLAEAIKKTPKSRYEIAARISELVGHEISKTTVDAWTAESKTAWRFPFEYAAAFEVACETNCLQELLARKRGARVLIGKDALYAELGRVKQQRDDLARHERDIQQYLAQTNNSKQR